MESLYQNQLRAFLDAEGRITKMPAKHKKRAYVYLWAANLFEPNRQYSEGEVNAQIYRLIAFNDPAQIRRALVDYGFMDRKPDGSAYWLRQNQPRLEDLLI